MFPFSQDTERTPLVNDQTIHHKKFFKFKGKRYGIDSKHALFALVALASVAGMLFTYRYLPTRSTSIRRSYNNKDTLILLAQNTSQTDNFCGTAAFETGYIKLPNKVDDHYFYWFVESQRNREEDPLVLWLTGGPGCSSILALLAENGPCHVNENLSTSENPYSWNKVANVIWLDQPSGVGFSYASPSDYDTHEYNVEENIYHFLQEFLHRHPDLKHQKLFITGESYGGHYVPVVAEYIVWKNIHRTSGSHEIPLLLEGIAIGNGLTDPEIQFNYFADMAHNAYNISLLSPQQITSMQQAQAHCIDLVRQCKGQRHICIQANEYCMYNLVNPFLPAGRNPYDIRQSCHEENIINCFHFEHIANFLNSPSVLQRLHINAGHFKSWQECNPIVQQGFAYDGVKSYAKRVKLLLDTGIRVLVYAGDADLLCNYIGNEAWTLAVPWTGQQGYQQQKPQPYTLKDIPHSVGTVRSFENLAFVRIYNAGHMVPMDQPQIALAMIGNFLNGSDFLSNE